jgi:acyl carrier protein phosphodiesterase
LNFVAHLILAGNDEDLRLGAMLGDFVRGRAALRQFDSGIRSGIMLHRHIDAFTDALPVVAGLRERFQTPFRRYAGIIIDLAFDHELVLRWEDYSGVSILQFDRDLRNLLARHHHLLPSGLISFMKYADRRGLFASYRHEAEILHSLKGISRRLSRPNPLGHVDEIWPEIKPLVAAAFEPAFRHIQSEVDGWLKSKSTMTGS